MQGIQSTNARRGGKFHYSNRGNANTRYAGSNRDWRLSQMLDDWEIQQEARKKEEALKEKAKERKEFTRDLAKIIHGEKQRKKKRESTSSESSISGNTSTPDTSPDTNHKKKSHKRKKDKKKKEMYSKPQEMNEIQRSLMELRNTNERIHKEIIDLKKHQSGTNATIERMEYEINTMINERSKVDHRITRLESQNLKGRAKEIISTQNETITEHVNLDSDDSETELKEKGQYNDDQIFDLALKFGIATCTSKSNLDKKFEKKTGTTKLKEFCEGANIKYITKNKAITDVWQLLLDNNITK